VANTFTAFFETLLAGAGEYNEAKVGQTALLDCVYKDVKTEAARIGKTVDVYFPDVGPMQNIGNGILTGVSVNPNYASLVFQNRVGKALQFQDFEQWQTATDLAQKFFDPLHKRAMEYMNAQIASLINTTQFNFNAGIVGAAQGEVQVTDSLNAWATLADQKVPMNDPEKLHLAVHNQVMRKMLGDTAWTQENIVGIAIAQEARETGKLANAFNFRPVWDQQMPTASGTIIYGQVQPTNGSAIVTGLATAFTSDLVAGTSYLTFGCDSTATQYLVQSIQSDTQLTLSANYTGVTPSALAGLQSATTARRITVLSGTLAPSTGNATVAGTNTLFTTQLTVGQWLVFASDATKTPYQVQSIASNTSLTLTATIAAAANSGSTSATVQSYTSLAFHEYAIALALRPIFTPPEARDVLDVMYIDLKGIPVRVMVSYQHIYQALYVTVDYGYALAVIRPDFGVVINT
jgi:hypothetical protein